MKYYLSTRYLEQPGVIQPVSIGLVAEDGQTFYAESTSFDERLADPYTWNTILKKLQWWPRGLAHFARKGTEGGVDHWTVFGPITTIRDSLTEFFFSQDATCPELYGYDCAHDWVIFYQIFGKRMYFPDRLPRYCDDLRQLAPDDETIIAWRREMAIELPDKEHALESAILYKKLHAYLGRKT